MTDHIPADATTASGEGRDLRAAVTAAAEALGLSLEQVDYKLDLSHFRSVAGGSVARTTVKVVAWARPADAPVATAELVGGAAPAAARGGDGEDAQTERATSGEEERRGRRAEDRRSDDRRGDDRRERRPREGGGRDRGDRPERAERPERREESPRGDIPAGANAASEWAVGWFAQLLPLMGLEGTVSGVGNEERVRLSVEVDKAGRLIGRRGATLGAIRHLLRLALDAQGHGDLIIDVDIPDARGDDERPRRDDRGGRERDDRGGRDRDDRGRGRDRDDRGRGRGRDRGDRDDRSKFPEEKLQLLARRAAEKALETGKAVTINAELNSYDRRIIHVEVSEIDGVVSESIEKDGTKFVRIAPDAD